MKYRAAIAANDTSLITDEDRQQIIEPMTAAVELWLMVMVFSSASLSFPFLIINKYVYSKLTHRPFVWLPTYTTDLLSFAFINGTMIWH